MISSTLFVAGVLIALVLGQPKPDDPSCKEGNTKKALDCCRLPVLIDSSIMDRCRTENPMTALAPGAQRTEGCCIMQCLLTTINAFSNNTINKEAVKRGLEQSIGKDVNFGPLINEVVDECYTLVNSDPAYKVAPVSATRGRPGCSFMPEGFVNCTKSKFFQKCPAAVWTKDAACDKLKQKSTSGCSLGSLME